MPRDQCDAITATSLRGSTRGSVGPPKTLGAQVTTLRRRAIEELLDVVEGPPATRIASRSEHHSPSPRLSAHTGPVISEETNEWPTMMQRYGTLQ
jgi:hypothetical protein